MRPWLSLSFAVIGILAGVGVSWELVYTKFPGTCIYVCIYCMYMYISRTVLYRKTVGNCRS